MEHCWLAPLPIQLCPAEMRRELFLQLSCMAIALLVLYVHILDIDLGRPTKNDSGAIPFMMRAPEPPSLASPLTASLESTLPQQQDSLDHAARNEMLGLECLDSNWWKYCSGAVHRGCLYEVESLFLESWNFLKPLRTKPSSDSRSKHCRSSEAMASCHRDRIQWLPIHSKLPWIPISAQVKVVQRALHFFAVNVLIEVGSGEGELLEAFRSEDIDIWSIELSEMLHQQAQRRLEQWRNTTDSQTAAQIRLLQGDSRAILPSLVREIEKEIEKKTQDEKHLLFYLDGHYASARFDPDEREPTEYASYSPQLTELLAIASSLPAHLWEKTAILMSNVHDFTAEGDMRCVDFASHKTCSGQGSIQAILDRFCSIFPQSHALLIVDDFLLIYPVQIGLAQNPYGWYDRAQLWQDILEANEAWDKADPWDNYVAQHAEDVVAVTKENPVLIALLSIRSDTMELDALPCMDSECVIPDCDLPCVWTWDKKKIPKAHGLMAIGGTKFPAVKGQHQVYVRTTMEPLWRTHGYLAVPEGQKMIDLTYTWNLNADVVRTFFSACRTSRFGCGDLVNKEGAAAQVDVNDYLWEMEPSLPDWDKISANPMLAEYIVAHCDSGNDRIRYLVELKQHLSYQVHGRRGNCPGLDNIPIPNDKGRATKLQMIRDYKFNFPWENANDLDWVTEKLLHALMAGVLPVWLGPRNVDEFVPDHSVINVLDYKQPEDLANALIALANNRTAYEAYHAWRSKEERHPKLDYFRKFSSMYPYAECRVCKEVHKTATERQRGVPLRNRILTPDRGFVWVDTGETVRRRVHPPFSIDPRDLPPNVRSSNSAA